MMIQSMVIHRQKEKYAIWDSHIAFGNPTAVGKGKPLPSQ